MEGLHCPESECPEFQKPCVSNEQTERVVNLPCLVRKWFNWNKDSKEEGGIRLCGPGVRAQVSHDHVRSEIGARHKLT